MASAGAGAAPSPSSGPAAARFESKFKKWIVSGSQEAGSAALTVEAERTHTVVVTDCGPAHVVVHGKPKILLVDTAAAVGLVVEGCICGCEVVNCRDVKLSVAKMVPSLMVDKSSNISIVFPTLDALDTQIVWCDAEAVSVQFKAADDAEPTTALLERPAGIDPRRQMVSKFERAPTGAFALVSRPFELFDDDAYMGMARPS